MRAAFKTGKTVAVQETTLRALAPDEIRIRVEACGVCGTDLHVDESAAPKQEPFGHEMAGTILECGAHVTRVTVGQKVVIESSTPCGQCAACRNANQECCANIQSFFCTGTFGFAEEAIVPAINALPYEGMSPAVASLSEPLGVAIDMVRLADLNINSNVLVMGPGPIGLMALALAKQAGVKNLFMSGTSRRPARRKVAEAIGIDGWVDTGSTSVTEYDFGCTIDRVLVTAPPSTLASAFDVAGRNGIISFIGIALGEGAFCRFDANAFHFKKLQLRASFASPALFTPMALEYLARGVVDGEALISHTYGLGDIQKALDVARHDPEAVKVMIAPQE